MTKARLSAISQRSLCKALQFIGVCSLLAIMIAATAYSQTPKTSAREFFEKAVGDWIGTCEQSTDGKKAENKYFHANIKQINPNTFSGQFEYFRLDPKTGGTLPIGKSELEVAIQPDGTAKSKITGQGIVLVDNNPKNQKHNFSELLIFDGNELQGKGSGTISVNGMPLGLGKNGKIKTASSTWAINNGVLNLSQSIKVGFKALIFNKSFKMDARYSAKRGTDVATLIPKVYAMPVGGHTKK